MKKWKIIIPIALSVIAVFLLIYPTIEIKTEDKLIAFRYSNDLEEFESDITDNAIRSMCWKNPIFKISSKTLKS